MRILVSPLDWGLGHASRCVPIIRALRQAGHQVVIYATGSGRILLQGEFPDLDVGVLSSFTLRYSRSAWLLPFWLLAQLPLFLISVLWDKFRVDGLIQKHDIDLVIADGRYGMFSRQVPSILITHQIFILPPGPRWLGSLLAIPLFWIHRLFLRTWNEIWVPDFPGPQNLSGRLGHPKTALPKLRYIFPLCRFRSETLPWNQPFADANKMATIDVMAWASGPEPQRSMFEKALRKNLERLPGTRILVRGVPSDKMNPKEKAEIQVGTLNVYDHLSGDDMIRFLTAADKVVCRSGYTSVMELAGLGKAKVLFVPTPGQSEQEYLAEHLAEAHFAAWQSQDNLNLEQAWKAETNGAGFLRLFPSNTESDFTLAGFIKNHPLLVVL